MVISCVIQYYIFINKVFKLLLYTNELNSMITYDGLTSTMSCYFIKVKNNRA